MTKEIAIKSKKTTIYAKLRGDLVKPMVFLHGFTGSHQCWDEVVSYLGYSTIAFDLPGHGKSTFNRLDDGYSESDWCNDLNGVLKFLNLEKISLCGYSMGGRLAIAFASRYPDKIEKLILESSCLGIKDHNLRKKRYIQDLILCNEIEADLVTFVSKWENNQLFTNQEERNIKGFLKQRKYRLLSNPMQLSKALKSFSQGTLDHMDKMFSDFKFPVKIITGSDDSKYGFIAKEMLKVNNNVIRKVIPDSGHNTHLEQSTHFIDFLKSF
tara:strand:- start:1092 stop:1895 length:804 start_codon:yes stop_codon:yes gene_type:complete